MKKLIFLTALLTFLLMSFVACSDKEDIDPCHEDPISLHTVVGKLTYNSDSTGYLLQIAEESDKLVNDTLIPMLNEKPAERVKVVKAKTNYSVTADGTKISSMVGSYVSILVGPRSIEKEKGSDDFILEFSYRISVIEYKRITYATPTIYPEAFTTVPLSRSSFNLSGHYELVDIYVHVLRKTNGEGENKEMIASQILNNLKSVYNESAHVWFRLVESDYIDYLTDDLIKNIDLDSKSDVNKIFALNNHANALDIYYLSYLQTDKRFYALGASAGIPSTAFILSPDFFTSDKYSPSHEAGHCFGLIHTHYGTDGKGGVPELVDGSNSTTAGDRIADTPADPNLWTWEGEYDYKKGLTDAHGQSYNPDPHNLMSYAHNSKQYLSAHYCPLKWTGLKIK